MGFNWQKVLLRMERQGLEYLTRSFQKLYLTLTSTDSYQTVSYPKTLMHGQESSRAEKRDLMTGDQRANKLFEQFFTLTYRYLNRFCNSEKRILPKRTQTYWRDTYGHKPLRPFSCEHWARSFTLGSLLPLIIEKMTRFQRISNETSMMVYENVSVTSVYHRKQDRLYC